MFYLCEWISQYAFTANGLKVESLLLQGASTYLVTMQKSYYTSRTKLVIKQKNLRNFLANYLVVFQHLVKK